MSRKSSSTVTAPLAPVLARFALGTAYDDLTEHVRHEGRRAFLNWMGCALGGSRAELLDKIIAVAGPLSGPPSATVIGRGLRLDALNTAYVNCVSSALHAFDDTHLESVAHPTGPIASALLAYSESHAVSGRDFLLALLIGVEIECRLGCALMTPPGQCPVSFTMNGLVGGIGAAAALSRLMGLSEQQTTSALGIAASQAGGFREGVGTMTRDLPMGQAARAGLFAVLLAREGFTAAETSLDGPKGFLTVFARTPNLAAATDGLGQRFDFLNNSYKPYPAGIVAHPVIDVCVTAAELHHIDSEAIERIDLRVHPDAIAVTGISEPSDGLAAQVSIYHWAAASFARRRAGIEEISDQAALDPRIVALRGKIHVEPDSSFGRDGAGVSVTLVSGKTHVHEVAHCLGSIARPLSDAQLEVKFRGQAESILTRDRLEELVAQCWRVDELVDVGECLRPLVS